VIEMIAGMTLEKLQTLTEPKLQLAFWLADAGAARDPRGPCGLTSSSCEEAHACKYYAACVNWGCAAVSNHEVPDRSRRGKGAALL